MRCWNDGDFPVQSACANFFASDDDDCTDYSVRTKQLIKPNDGNNPEKCVHLSSITRGHDNAPDRSHGRTAGECPSHQVMQYSYCILARPLLSNKKRTVHANSMRTILTYLLSCFFFFYFLSEIILAPHGLMACN